ncbi:MAG: Unknown protein, partial [uncultured Sulfurovum sp.]
LILKNLGLSATQAINIFYQKIKPQWNTF